MLQITHTLTLDYHFRLPHMNCISHQQKPICLHVVCTWLHIHISFKKFNLLIWASAIHVTWTSLQSPPCWVFGHLDTVLQLSQSHLEAATAVTYNKTLQRIVNTWLLYLHYVKEIEHLESDCRVPKIFTNSRAILIDCPAYAPIG
jgi:hypothetical protein